MANHVHLPKTVRKNIHRTTGLVSLTLIPTKFIEQILLEKISRLMDSNNLTWNSKYGFNKSKSCLINLSSMMK